MAVISTDRIEQTIELPARRARVWQALTDTAEFGTWFCASFSGPFRPGARLKCRITSPGYEHLVFDLIVETMEQPRLFSFRWHPNAIDAARDYSAEPMTLVEFTLADCATGTLLTVTESGFDGIPLARRGEAFKNNSDGWAIQMGRIGAYLRPSS